MPQMAPFMWGSVFYVTVVVLFMVSLCLFQVKISDPLVVSGGGSLGTNPASTVISSSLERFIWW